MSFEAGCISTAAFWCTATADAVGPPASPAGVASRIRASRTAKSTLSIGDAEGVRVRGHKGWAKEEGGDKREIKPGDAIWSPPGAGGTPSAEAATRDTAVIDAALRELLAAAP